MSQRGGPEMRFSGNRQAISIFPQCRERTAQPRWDGLLFQNWQCGRVIITPRLQSHGFSSKPTRPILLCPWERHFKALSPAWWSWQTVLNFSHISIKFQADSNILTSPEANWGNCYPSGDAILCISASVALLQIRKINIEMKKIIKSAFAVRRKTLKPIFDKSEILTQSYRQLAAAAT